MPTIATEGSAAWSVCYTLLPVKAIGQDKMSFRRDTRVAPHSTVMSINQGF